MFLSLLPLPPCLYLKFAFLFFPTLGSTGQRNFVFVCPQKYILIELKKPGKMSFYFEENRFETTVIPFSNCHFKHHAASIYGLGASFWPRLGGQTL